MTASLDGIVVRRPRVVYRARADWEIADGPELAAMIVALSLLMPHLEPYLIRSMQAAKRHVGSSDVLAGLALFCAQEGQHHALHTRFNQSLGLPPSPRLDALIAEVAADYQRFTRTRSLRFNLAYAEGFEAFTMAAALFFFEHRWNTKLRGDARELMEWHLVEELEHRTVAFDVYRDVVGSYPVRLAVGIFAQWHLLRFVFRAGAALLATLPREETSGPAARARAFPLYGLAIRRFFPRAFATLLPGYTPHATHVPESVRAMATRYTALWSEPRAAE